MPKYVWGDEPFDLNYIPLCILFGALLNSFALELGRYSSSAQDYRGVICVTLAWLHGYYNTVSAQINVKMNGSVMGLDDAKQMQALKVAERSLYNTLEQGVPFLIMLWLAAVFIDNTSIALYLGWAYVLPRMLYPLAYSYHGHFSMWCELITQPNYQTLFYFKTTLLFHALNMGELEKYWPQDPNASFCASVAFFFVGGILDQLVCWSWPAGYPSAVFNMRANLAEVQVQAKVDRRRKRNL